MQATSKLPFHLITDPVFMITNITDPSNEVSNQVSSIQTLHEDVVLDIKEEDEIKWHNDDL
jgi:hypothetical protein